MRRQYTPQEKKRKSLEHDGRNCYGENSKSSRKAIPRRKALANRAGRHAASQTLFHSNDDVDVLHESVRKVKRGDWKKAPDAALGNKLLTRLLRQIITRVTAAKDPAKLLASLETRLTEIGTSSKAVQDILKQLHGIVRARNSITLSGRSWTPLKIDYDMATAIVAILNKAKTKE
jgi:hypothetical protein